MHRKYNPQTINPLGSPDDLISKVYAQLYVDMHMVRKFTVQIY